MKTKEEIEQLAKEHSVKLNNDDDAIEFGFFEGYTQCQEDMADDILDNLENYTLEYEKNNADKKYAEEDIKEAIDMARMLSYVSCLEDGEHRLKYSNTEDEIIN